MYQSYRLTPESYKVIRRKVFQNFFFLMIAIILVMASVYFFGNADSSFDVQMVIITLVIFILSSMWGIFSVTKHTKALHESYCFTITDQWVQREQFKSPAIRIMLEDIESITHHNGGGFTIKGKGKYNYIVVSKYAEPYEQLEHALKQIRPFSEFSPSMRHFEKLKLASTLIVVLLGLFVFLARSKWLVGVSGTLLSGYLLWYLNEQRRIKNSGQPFQKYRVSYILLLIFIIIFMLIRFAE